MNRIKPTLKVLLLSYVALGVMIGAFYSIRQLTKRALPPVTFEVL